MSRAFDKSRLKIVSNQPSLSGVRSAGERDILWPVSEFRVSIPAYREKPLNIFEETLVKLLMADPQLNVEGIAKLTCLKPDLVRFIQNRLNHLDLLDDRNRPTAEAEKLIEEWDQNPTELIPIKMYIDLISGSILPIIARQQMGNVSVLDASSYNRIQFHSGSIGRSTHNITAKLLPPSIINGSKPLEKESVLQIIRSFNKLQERFENLREDSDHQTWISPTSGAITVEEAPELVFLHAKLVIQRGDTEVLISDPFGFGISTTLTQAFKTLVRDNKDLAGWILKLKQKFDPKNIQPETKLNSNISAYKYPEIESRLNKAISDYKEAKAIADQTQTSTHENKAEELKLSTLLHLYEAVEWTLRQINHEYSVSHWVKNLSQRSKADLQRLLTNWAQKIGFNVRMSGGFFRGVTFNSYIRGTTEIKSLLALGLASAANDPVHPINRLATHDPDILSCLIVLKGIRDTINHGHEQEVKIASLDASYLHICPTCQRIYKSQVTQKTCADCGHELQVHKTLLEHYIERICKMVKILCPSVKLAGGIEVEIPDLDEIEYEYYRARINYEQYFGLTVPVELASLLRDLELQWPMHLDEPRNLAKWMNLISSAMQSSLHIIIEMHGERVATQDPMTDALLNAEAAGFKLENQVLPESVSSVREHNLERALMNENTTLGANLIALLVLIPIETLASIGSQGAQLIQVVAQIINLRGHGNKSTAKLRSEIKDLGTLRALKETSYQMIKLMLEL